MKKVTKDNKDFYRGYSELHSKIVSFLKNKLNGDLPTAEDLTSETFIKVYKNIDKFKENNGDNGFSSWVYKIARNTFIDYLRKTSKVKTVELKEEITHSKENIEENYLQKELSLMLNTAVKGLNEREKQIITLKFYEGKTNQEIANILNISSTNVGTIIFRVINKLKTNLNESSNNKFKS